MDLFFKLWVPAVAAWGGAVPEFSPLESHYRLGDGNSQDVVEVNWESKPGGLVVLGRAARSRQLTILRLVFATLHSILQSLRGHAQRLDARRHASAELL